MTKKGKHNQPKLTFTVEHFDDRLKGYASPYDNPYPYGAKVCIDIYDDMVFESCGPSAKPGNLYVRGSSKDAKRLTEHYTYGMMDVSITRVTSYTYKPEGTEHERSAKRRKEDSAETRDEDGRRAAS